MTVSCKQSAIFQGVTNLSAAFDVQTQRFNIQTSTFDFQTPMFSFQTQSEAILLDIGPKITFSPGTKAGPSPTPALLGRAASRAPAGAAQQRPRNSSRHHLKNCSLSVHMFGTLSMLSCLQVNLSLGCLSRVFLVLYLNK